MGLKLPEAMDFVHGEIAKLGIPLPSDMGVTIEATPMQVAGRILVVGSYLSRLEYLIGMSESFRMTLHEVVQSVIDEKLIEMDPKLTIRHKEAVITQDASINNLIQQRINYAALIEQVKAYRNAYKAQYDALSRMLSAKQIEAELSRT